MYLGETELAEMIDLWSRDRSHVMYWWYRDSILQAQERGLVKVIAHTEEMPFWWRAFSESIEVSDRFNELVAKIRQKDNK